MGILAKILGSGDVVEKGLELIDDMWETDAEARASKTESKINLMNAYAPFKLAQRYIALAFTYTFLACFFLVLALTLAGISKTDDVIAVMEAFNIKWAMIIILTFYFGGGLI